MAEGVPAYDQETAQTAASRANGSKSKGPKNAGKAASSHNRVSHGLLAASMWQIMRNNSIEVALFDIEISNLSDEIRRTYEDMDEYGRIALAFKKANGDNSLELLRRYRSTSERAYHRASR